MSEQDTGALPSMQNDRESVADVQRGLHCSFRDWLERCIHGARYIPDALDPVAAYILENVLRQYDRITVEDTDALRSVLKPFVRHYEPWMDEARWEDGDQMSTFARITFGDLRRARAALARPLPEPQADDGWRSRRAEEIWQRACVGREGYCSSDLQDAAKWAIGEAFRLAEAAARSSTLPAGYEWSKSNREKFDFGRDTASDAISMLAASPAPPATTAGEG